MAKVKKVYKYGTGKVIPEGAVYLCTQTESLTYPASKDIAEMKEGTIQRNVLVWHYFLVEVEDE
jgi:hypothetical protein